MRDTQFAQYKNTVTTSGDFEGGNFGIDEESVPFIASILRDRLYKDKILAPIREYICNAYDAHIEAGRRDRQIEITVPTYLNPVFKVRDFGYGLSKEEISDLYTKYGKSTKRNTNNQIGSFGIGCKSGFCASDSFLVTSYYDGFKNVYNCYLADNGESRFSLISSEETDEPTGVEITIPINPSDIYTWVNKTKNFVKYIKPLPIIFGVDLDLEIVRNNIFVQNDEYVVYKNNTYGHSFKLIMGLVSYDVKTDLLNLTDPEDIEKLELINQFDIELFCKIGKVSVGPNREDLEYTKQTISFVSEKIREIYDAIINSAVDKYKNLPEYERILEINQLQNELNNLFTEKLSRTIINSYFKSNPEFLSKLSLEVNKDDILSIKKITQGPDYNGHDCFQLNLKTIDLNDYYTDNLKYKVIKKTAFVLVDQPNIHQLRCRYITLLETYGTVYLFNVKDVSSFLTQDKYKWVRFINLSSVVPKVLPKKDINDREKVKEQVWCFRENYKTVAKLNTRFTKKDVDWKQLKNEDCYYVVKSYDNIYDGDMIFGDHGEFHALYILSSILGIDFEETQLIALTPAQKKKAEGNNRWINLLDEVRRLAAIYTDQNEFQNYITLSKNSPNNEVELPTTYNWISSSTYFDGTDLKKLLEDLESLKFKENPDFEMFLKYYGFIDQDKYIVIRDIRKQAVPCDKYKNACKNFVLTFKDKYPLLHTLMNVYAHNSHSYYLSELTDKKMEWAQYVLFCEQEKVQVSVDN